MAMLMVGMGVWPMIGAMAGMMGMPMVGAKHPEIIFVVQRPGIFRMLPYRMLRDRPYVLDAHGAVREPPLHGDQAERMQLPQNVNAPGSTKEAVI